VQELPIGRYSACLSHLMQDNTDEQVAPTAQSDTDEQARHPVLH